MFFKMMVMSGFLVSWVLMFLVTVFILSGFVGQERKVKGGMEIEVYYRNLTGTFTLNTIMALVSAYTITLLTLDLVYWYWSLLGLIVTFVVNRVMYVYIRIGRKIASQDLTSEEEKSVRLLGIKRIKEQISKSKWIFSGAVLLSIGAYAVVALNAWDIVPFRERLFPPMMPIYVHMFLDWFQLAFVFAINFLVLVAMKRWVVYQKMLNRITSNQII